jgi:ribose/xylose/arabinose/galactoside ABC-type transport system permease subunit
MISKLNTTFSNAQRFLPLLATVLLFFVVYMLGAMAYEPMRSPQVFLNLFRNTPFLLISAVGMTFVIISGGIDLSVSGVAALTTVASAALLREGMNAWVVILLMLVMGMALGTIMGSFITYLKVQPFIVTLAGMWVARGLCFFISDDRININNRIYTILARTQILIPGLADPVAQTGPFISIPVVIAVMVLLVALYVLHSTRFGRTVYAIGGGFGANEQSSRLMGLPVNRVKIIVYTLNGFCSALAGITMSMMVMSGHGLYAQGFELTVIAAVVMGGTMLTGGQGYVFGTLFGVLVYAIIQALIQFNGKLSSWWTNIAVGLLMLMFIGVQSLLAARKTRQLARKEGAGVIRRRRTRLLGRRPLVTLGSGAAVVIVLAVLGIMAAQGTLFGIGINSSITDDRCELKPYRQDQAASLMEGGAVIVFERNGGSRCTDYLYAIYPDGLIVGDDGTNTTEKQVTPEKVTELLSAINEQGWFTDEMYDTWHTPCKQCYGHYVTVSYDGQERTVTGVNGGADAPPEYWHVVSLITGLLPEFSPTE